MTRKERRELLERMIKANDAMSPEKPIKAYDYAECFILLSNSIESKHASALWQFKREEENLYAMNQSRREHETEMEWQIREHQENVVEILEDASIESLKYFLESDKEPIEPKPPLT